ncbi:MAG TPA: cation transporter [Lacipirellulaceae bacterium]|jgi:copper chaperone CopZ|nr:cation transporter [Lacipirellulaceae bacterium]
MTRTIGLACILAIIAGCNSQPVATSSGVARSARATAFNSAGAPTVEFALPNLVCDDEECALAVKDILARQPGTEDVLVDVETKTATVAIDEGKFDSQIALADLVDRGFDLKLATPAVFNPAGALTVDFAVPDMMCEEGCASTVKDILSKQPGAKDVHVDFAAKIATVAIDEETFDPQLAVAELVDKGFGNSALANSAKQRP